MINLKIGDRVLSEKNHKGIIVELNPPDEAVVDVSEGGYKYPLEYCSASKCTKIDNSHGHICPYCKFESYQINEHFSHIELEHPGKPVI